MFDFVKIARGISCIADFPFRFLIDRRFQLLESFWFIVQFSFHRIIVERLIVWIFRGLKPLPVIVQRQRCLRLPVSSPQVSLLFFYFVILFLSAVLDLVFYLKCKFIILIGNTVSIRNYVSSVYFQCRFFLTIVVLYIVSVVSFESVYIRRLYLFQVHLLLIFPFSFCLANFWIVAFLSAFVAGYLSGVTVMFWCALLGSTEMPWIRNFSFFCDGFLLSGLSLLYFDYRYEVFSVCVFLRLLFGPWLSSPFFFRAVFCPVILCW